jgi:hypothetical protein
MLLSLLKSTTCLLSVAYENICKHVCANKKLNVSNNARFEQDLLVDCPVKEETGSSATVYMRNAAASMS